MEALQLTFLFLLPLSNLFYCLCHGLLYSKIPKQVFFDPYKYILTLLHTLFTVFINSTFFRLTSKNNFYRNNNQDRRSSKEMSLNQNKKKNSKITQTTIESPPYIHMNFPAAVSMVYVLMYVRDVLEVDRCVNNLNMVVCKKNRPQHLERKKVSIQAKRASIAYMEALQLTFL